MAGTISKLSDEHLERVRHLIRRDELTDLEIAQEAERLHGAALWDTDAARARAISRYGNSTAFRRWRDRWENQDVMLKKDLALQEQAFEYMTTLLRDTDEDAFERASKFFLAKSLTAAAKMNEEEFLGAMSARGSVATTLRLCRDMITDSYRQRAEALKAQLTALSEGGGDEPALSMESVVATVDNIMGLK